MEGWKLFAVCLGGRAPKSNTELHDIVFAVGETIEDTYPQLLNLWCGTPEGLHIDSWIALDVVDGHRVGVETSPAAGAKKLFFVNLGVYRDGTFGEEHVNRFLVASTAAEAKARAKRDADDIAARFLHTDNLWDVGERLDPAVAKGIGLALDDTDAPEALVVNNGYHPLPEAALERHRSGR